MQIVETRYLHVWYKYVVTGKIELIEKENRYLEASDLL